MSLSGRRQAFQMVPSSLQVHRASLSYRASKSARQVVISVKSEGRLVEGDRTALLTA